MYALLGRMRARAGKRDEVIDLMTGSTEAMPGCRLYVVGRDAGDDDTICVTEIWDSKADHEASLQIPAVRETIDRAMPMLDLSDAQQFPFEPVGGHGIDFA